MGPETDLRNS